MGHVFARLAGHGMILLPHWPYVFERADGDAVRVTRATPDGPAQVVITPGAAADGGDVVEVTEGPDHPYWVIETSLGVVPWPSGFSLDSPDDSEDHTPFYLFGPDQVTIFPQGPVPAETLADPEALVADDQTVLDRRTNPDGTSVIELAYRHEDHDWWQAHWSVPVSGDRILVYTAQAPAEHAGVASEAVAAVATGRQ